MIQTLMPLTVTAFVVIGLMLYVLLKAPKRYILKFVLIPATLLAVLFSYEVVIPMLGYALQTTVDDVPDKFWYLGHRVVVKDNKKSSVEIWVNAQGVSRLYSIPYTKQLEEDMKQAESKKREGPVGMKKRRGPKQGERGSAQESDDDSGFDLYKNVPEGTLPKDTPPPQEREQEPEPGVKTT